MQYFLEAQTEEQSNRSTQGITSNRQKGEKSSEQCTHLIELVTQIYRIDVVAFQIREHDNLFGDDVQTSAKSQDKRCGRRTKKTIVKRSPAAMRTAKRNNQPIHKVIQYIK